MAIGRRPTRALCGQKDSRGEGTGHAHTAYCEGQGEKARNVEKWSGGVQGQDKHMALQGRNLRSQQGAREREREKETDRQTDRQRDRDREISERAREREPERDRERQGETERDSERQ